MPSFEAGSHHVPGEIEKHQDSHTGNQDSYTGNPQNHPQLLAPTSQLWEVHHIHVVGGLIKKNINYGQFHKAN